MAAPSFVKAATTPITDASGAWAVSSAAPNAAGNLYLVHILQDGTSTGANQPTISSVTHAEALDGTDSTLTKLGTWALGSEATPVAYQHIWAGRSLDTTAMAVTGANAGGDDVYVNVYEFAGVAAGTDAAGILENTTAGNITNGVGSSNTAADTAVVTAAADRLALNFLAVNDDNPFAGFTGQTGGTWATLASFASSTGTDGAIYLAGARTWDETVKYLVGTTLYGSGIRGGSGSDADQQWAQRFIAPVTGTALHVLLKLGKASSPADNLVVELQSDSAGNPSGTVLAYSSIAGGSISSGTIYPFDLSYAVVGGTTYHIVLRRDGARDTTNYYQVYISTAAYADGVALILGAAGWLEAGGGGDMVFAAYPFCASTIDGGTGSITDSDGWGVVGFALKPPTAGGLTYEETGFGKENG